MKISDTISPRLFTLSCECSLQDAAFLFLENGIDGAPVVDEDQRLLGLVTKTHLYRAIVNQQLLSLRVKEIMSTQINALNEDFPAEELHKLTFRRYPVLCQNKVVGMITKSDVYEVLLRELKDVNSKMQAVLDSAYNSIVSIDENRIIRTFNRAAEGLFEKSRENVIGRPYSQIFPEGALSEILDTGSVAGNIKYVYNGKTIISNQTTIFKEDGTIAGAVAIAQDVSDLENTARELTLTKEKKEKLDTLLSASMDSFFVADSQGVVINVNKAYSEITGIQAKDILGRSMYDLVEEGYYKKPATIMVLENQQPVVYKETTSTGKVALFTGIPIFDEQGDLTNVLVNVRDITDLELISGELERTREIKEELDKVIQSSFDGIMETDANSCILIVNDAYIRITGISRKELVGKNEARLVRDGYYDHSVSLMVIKEGKPVTIEQKLKNGKKLLVTGNPVFNERGELLRIIINARDLTELEQLRQDMEHAQELNRHYLEELQKMRIGQESDFVAESQQSKDIIDLIMRVCQVDTTVLIQGESGVGKEIVAQELHKHSPRCLKPFIKINCAAIPEALLESELFGYNAGAFTGASKHGKMGIFELANKGSLFLDEVGDIPVHLQVKLLRVLQECEFTRVGGSKPIQVDVRVIAATNRNLAQMVAEGTFREDLYYRLNIIPIFVPPLRERKEEIAPLVRHFLQMFNKKYGLTKTITASALGLLMEYNWPGNIRELRNVIERALVTSTDSVIREFSFLNVEQSQPKAITAKDYSPIDLKREVEEYEKQIIKRYIDNYGSLRKAARYLSSSQTTLWRKANQYGIKCDDTKNVND